MDSILSGFLLNLFAFFVIASKIYPTKLPSIDFL